jgi:protocatechuate 3,4-dioxygenase beta subunit
MDLGESIASEGKGQHMCVERRVLNTKGEPIPGAVIETWEADEMSLSFRRAALSPRGGFCST